MRTGDGFMCVYSIIDRKTFDEVKEFREQILRVKDVEQIPMCIVGNKCDLESERVIPKEEGSAMAKNFGSAFFETSAKLRKNVDESFYELVREVRKARLAANKKPKRRMFNLVKKKIICWPKLFFNFLIFFWRKVRNSPKENFFIGGKKK